MNTLAVIIVAVVGIYCVESQDSNSTANSGSMTSCQNGWFHYEQSCYFYSRYADKKSYAAAKAACEGMGAGLFVPNTRPEFDEVMQQASRTEWTWIGLTAQGDHPGDANFFQWENPSQNSGDMSSGLNVTSLPFLNKVGPAHGQVAGSNCAGYYGGLTQDAAYIHWYSCDLLYQFICEKMSIRQ